MTENLYSLDDLICLMQRLRDPERGCPWDLKQTCQSIVSSTLEEVYEVVEAIENNDIENLREELGDLLFQVVFYCQMSSENHYFNFQDVAHAIVAKLVRRHPHVFPTGKLHDDIRSVQPLTDIELHAQWERIKQDEKKLRPGKRDEKQYLLSDIPAAIPALQRAYKIQKKLATVGFDWKTALEVFPIVEQEMQEVREAMDACQPEKVEEELGDVLFAVVNLCRHLGVEPETALRSANRKVQQRFSFVEDALQEKGKTPDNASLDEMEALWQQAKRRLPSSTSSG